MSKHHSSILQPQSSIHMTPTMMEMTLISTKNAVALIQSDIKASIIIFNTLQMLLSFLKLKVRTYTRRCCRARNVTHLETILTLRAAWTQEFNKKIMKQIEIFYNCKDIWMKIKCIRFRARVIQHKLKNLHRQDQDYSWINYP